MHRKCRHGTSLTLKSIRKHAVSFTECLVHGEGPDPQEQLHGNEEARDGTQRARCARIMIVRGNDTSGYHWPASSG